MVNVRLIYVLIAMVLVGGLVGTLSIVRAQQRDKEPFRTLVRQTDPPIILFEHVATKRCFLATSVGGLISVERTLCESLPPITPPIIDRPISPEK